MNAPSSDAVPLTSSSLPTASDAGQVAGASLATVEKASLNTPSIDAVPLETSSPSAALDAGLPSRNLLFWLLAKAKAKAK